MLRKAYLNAMEGLETGLTVRDIAVFGLSDCHPDERIGIVRGRVDRYDFDNVPYAKMASLGVVENIKDVDIDETAGRSWDTLPRNRRFLEAPPQARASLNASRQKSSKTGLPHKEGTRVTGGVPLRINVR